MVKTIIVDDEPGIREMLKLFLSDYFTDIKVIAEAEGVDDAIAVIEHNQPDLLFLDIEIKGGTGFHVLQKLKSQNFKLIFITAFNEFAIQAIKFSALDYILKPVNEFEFKAGVEKALRQIETSKPEQTEALFYNYHERQGKKVVLRTSGELHVVDLNELVRCQADNTYTIFYLVSGEKIMVSNGLGEYSEILSPFGFVRTHQSHLVNIGFVRKFDKTNGGSLILKDKTSIPVSTRHKAGVLEILGKL